MEPSKDISCGVGYIPSGLFIVAIKNDNDSIDGYLASWVQQISFSPLMISLAINPGRPGYENIIGGKTFSVNVVGEHDTQYLRHFWKGYTEGQSPFNEINHEITGNNGVLIKGAKSTIDCQFVSKTTPGDHEIVIAKVLDSYVNDENAKPKVHIRKSGMDY